MTVVILFKEEPCFQKNKQEGLTDEEIGAVQSIVMAVSAGKIRAQFRDVRIKRKKSRQKKAQEK